MATSFGVDVGGSGIKGVYVGLETGNFSEDRLKTKTLKNSTPEATVDVCCEILETEEVPSQMPVGITIPGPVKNDILGFMADLDRAWVGVNTRVLMRRRTGYTIHCVNDINVAGYAEPCFDAAKDAPGSVIITILGTGVGATLIYNGVLVPNCELGHLELDSHDAEIRAPSGMKTVERLPSKEWTERLQKYYSHPEMLSSSDLFAIGSRVSREHEEFLPLLDLETPIIPVQLFNQAKIVGTAAPAAGV